jgi:hypothetical protein
MNYNNILKNQTIFFKKKLILKKDMQNPWLGSWDHNKPIEKKLKIITKLILKKNNAKG